MKKRNTFLGVAMLIAVLALGIGYALTTGPLKITGTATANESTSSFKVKFASAKADTATDTASSTAAITSDTAATMEVSLTNVNDTQTATFEVENASQTGLKAVLTKENVIIAKDAAGNEKFSSDYFTVETSWDETGATISAGNKATLTVTVTLKKAVVGASVEENFYIVLKEFTAEQE